MTKFTRRPKMRQTTVFTYKELTFKLNWMIDGNESIRMENAQLLVSITRWNSGQKIVHSIEATKTFLSLKDLDGTDLMRLAFRELVEEPPLPGASHGLPEIV
jgi:hypothetical protein